MRTLWIVFALSWSAASIAQNPHDGYAFWLPNGEVSGLAPAGGSHSFDVALRRTRFDTPRGQLVIVATVPPTGAPEVRVDGQVAGRLGGNTFLPAPLTQGKRSIQIEIAGAPEPNQTYRLYYTDDAHWLGRTIMGSGLEGPGLRTSPYDLGLAAFWRGDYATARDTFVTAANRAAPREARLLRRWGRWCAASLVAPRLTTAEGHYGLGLYSMTNGFWKLAERSFTRATELAPDNPDAWFMRAKATAYVHSDLGEGVARAYPYYKKAADLYPREGAGELRQFFGLFRKLRVRDGEGTRVLEMTDDQIAHAKLNWEWCTAIIESSSRGALRLQNTWKEFTEEFDATAEPGGWGAGPYEGLFERGTQDVFIRMTGWGASACLGMDCGPNRTAFMDLGIREWDVMLHEWNHALDWALITSELGIGVPVTHSSDWCGYQPISSMGMGHLSSNRYATTPGMYRFVRGYDTPSTPWIDSWKAVQWPTEVAPTLPRDAIVDPNRMDPWRAEQTRRVAEMTPPPRENLVYQPETRDGYVDLQATYPMAPANATAFAHTWVYSPRQQRVRAWLGADDNLRVWLNGRLVHRGVYWAVTLFTERREKDQVAAAWTLERGWNSLMVQVTSLQRAPCWLGGDPPNQWGFSVRLCTQTNAPIEGLRWQADEPAGDHAPAPTPIDARAPRTYRWETVADDYTALLPEITLHDLRAITGYANLNVTAEMWFDQAAPEIAGFPLATRPDPGVIRLDNELNWYFSPWEYTALVRFRRAGSPRDLWFIRPDGFEPYLTLARVAPEARRQGIVRHAHQVIGWFRVPREDSPNGRIVLVVDTYLGDRLPVDEEDLLSLAALR